MNVTASHNEKTAFLCSFIIPRTMKNEKYFFLPVQNIQKQQAKFECCRKNMYNNDKKSKMRPKKL